MTALGIEERVRIYAEVIEKGTENLDKIAKKIHDFGQKVAKQQRFINKEMSGGAQKLVENATRVNQLGKQYNTFGSVMAMPLDKWKKFNQEGGTFQTRTSRMANGIRMATHGLRGFRMEMLGVMFFGMNMQKMFMGFLKPVMEAYGVFELFRDMLLITFIPTMDALLDPFLRLFDYMTSLPESTQKLIGTFTLLAVVLSTLLMFFGVFSLGIGSIIQVVPLLVSTFGGLFSGIATVVGGLSALFAVLAVIIIGFVLAWKENFGDIKEWTLILWEGIKNIFGGVFQVIGGIVKAFVSLIKGDFTGFSAAIKSIFTGIWRIITGIFQTISGFIVTLSLSVFRVVTGIYTFIYQAWEKLFDVTKVVWQRIVDFIMSVLNTIIRGISSLISKIATLLKLKGGGGGRGGGGGGSVDDFIWRPGSAPVSVNPNDTIVGAKGGLGGIGTTVNYSPVYYINVSDKTEFERMLDSNNKSMVDDIKRMIGA